MLKAVSQVSLSSVSTQTTVASGSAVSLTTTATAYNVTSKSLGAGAYLVWGIVDFSLSSVTATEFRAAVSVNSATLPTQAGGSGLGPDPLDVLPVSPAISTDVIVLMGGPTILTITATTTVYLVAQATFSAGTVSAYGTFNAINISVP